MDVELVEAPNATIFISFRLIEFKESKSALLGRKYASILRHSYLRIVDVE